MASCLTTWYALICNWLIFNQFFIALIWGFDRGREPLNVEEEYNGDEKGGYVYRKLVKERSHFLLDMFRIKSSYGLYTTPFELKKHCR